MNRFSSPLNSTHLLQHPAGKLSSLVRPITSWSLSLAIGGAAIVGSLASLMPKQAIAEESVPAGQPMTLLADVQEANAVTGVVTARGNVQIFYPARNMQATAVQAQYYSREGRIVLNTQMEDLFHNKMPYKP